jgi:hypothetical protein
MEWDGLGTLAVLAPPIAVALTPPWPEVIPALRAVVHLIERTSTSRGSYLRRMHVRFGLLLALQYHCGKLSILSRLAARTKARKPLAPLADDTPGSPRKPGQQCPPCLATRLADASPSTAFADPHSRRPAAEQHRLDALLPRPPFVLVPRLPLGDAQRLPLAAAWQHRAVHADTATAPATASIAHIVLVALAADCSDSSEDEDGPPARGIKRKTAKARSLEPAALAQVIA